jgi:hypothetical protein
MNRKRFLIESETVKSHVPTISPWSLGHGSELPPMLDGLRHSLISQSHSVCKENSGSQRQMVMRSGTKHMVRNDSRRPAYDRWRAAGYGNSAWPCAISVNSTTRGAWDDDRNERSASEIIGIRSRERKWAPWRSGECKIIEKWTS